MEDQLQKWRQSELHTYLHNNKIEADEIYSLPNSTKIIPATCITTRVTWNFFNSYMRQLTLWTYCQFHIQLSCVTVNIYVLKGKQFHIIHDVTLQKCCWSSNCCWKSSVAVVDLQEKRIMCWLSVVSDISWFTNISRSVMPTLCLVHIKVQVSQSDCFSIILFHKGCKVKSKSICSFWNIKKFGLLICFEHIEWTGSSFILCLQGINKFLVFYSLTYVVSYIFSWTC